MDARHVLLPTTDSEGDDRDGISVDKHPLDSSSRFNNCMNSIFQFWVYKIVQMREIKFEDITTMPKHLQVHHAYKVWKRHSHRMNRSTLSTIWSIHKHTIIKMALLQTVYVLLIGICFYIFVNRLFHVLTSIHTHNIYSLLPQLTTCAVYIFLLGMTGTVLETYQRWLGYSVQGRVISCLLLSIYDKTLSLDINESDKQQVVSIIGSDIPLIDKAFDWLTAVSVMIISCLFFAIVAMYFVLGVPSLFALLFLIVFAIPSQLYCGTKYSLSIKEKLMYADKRIQLISQLMRGIRLLKVSCYELPLMDKIKEYRTHETTHMLARDWYMAVLFLLNLLIPILMFLIALVIYLWGFANKIDSKIILYMIIIMSVASTAVRGIPSVIGYAVSLAVACDRIDTYFHRNSVVSNNETMHIPHGIAIQIRKASFVWTESNQNTEEDKQDNVSFSLQNVSLDIEKGKLVAIMGSVGSGKSSLFEAILGEMKCVQGTMNVNLNNAKNDEIAFCSQAPYIRNATLRENIILDLEYDEEKYKHCVFAACLGSDLEKLPHYDLTMIGDEGVNISGGQKTRVAFARALYRMDRDCNLFLFDDPLSSIDIEVGKHMFFHGIYNYLFEGGTNSNDNTILMVINSHLHLVHYFDEIIILDQGKIVTHCTVKSLYSDGNSVFQQYEHLLPNKNQIYFDNNDNSSDIVDSHLDVKLQELYTIIRDKTIPFDLDLKPPSYQLYVEYLRSAITPYDHESYWDEDSIQIQKSEELKNSHTHLIFKIVLPLMITFLVQCCLPMLDVSILLWSTAMDKGTADTSHAASVICVLLLLVLATFLFPLIFRNIASQASTYIHSKTLLNIMRANTLFFDTTPRGEILGLFSSDTNSMDNILPNCLYLTVLFACSTVGSFCYICIVMPMSFIPFAILISIILYMFYRSWPSMLSTLLISKQLSPPIITLFAEAASNLDSIRAYKLKSFFMEDMEKRIDAQRMYKFTYQSIFLWQILNVRFVINLMIVASIYCSAFHINIAPHTDLNTLFIVLACWYCLQMQQQIVYITYFLIFVQSCFVSVNRLVKYHTFFQDNKRNADNEIVHEARQTNTDYAIDKNTKWPTRGCMDIAELRLKYREQFDVVLDINQPIKIEHGSKIGVCGRTGSGKSSILVSLFRLFEPMANSKLIIDGLDFKQLGLRDLRSNLSIITQTPILFGDCTLRFNLDPFDVYTDDEIWNAIKSVNISLYDLIQERDGKLGCLIAENGSNFSVGQKQLICFARAMLNNSTILCMDEATSSIDKSTDNIIQKLIRSQMFDDTTVISIAHRIQTIIDYDYILVLNNGKVAQYDTPTNLLQQKDGPFANLVRMDKLYQYA
eukprot:577655_1